MVTVGSFNDQLETKQETDIIEVLYGLDVTEEELKERLPFLFEKYGFTTYDAYFKSEGYRNWKKQLAERDHERVV